MRRALFAVAALAAVVSSACNRGRKPIAVHDMGPAVEVVEAERRAPDRPKLPLADENEPDDDVAHAQPIPMGSGIRGFIGAPHDAKGKPAGDDDFFQFMAPGASTAAPADLGGGRFDYARVEVTGVPGLDLALEVLDGDGKRLVLVNDGGAGEGEVIPNVGVDPAHTYYLRVREAGVPKGDAGHAYELTAQTWHAGAGDEREPNDDPAHATAISLSKGTAGEASGFLGRKRDEDWLRLSLAGVPAQEGRALLRLELAPVEGVTAVVKVQADVPSTKGAPAAVFAETKALKNEELRLRNVAVDAAAGSVLIAVRAVDGRSVEGRWLLRIGVEPPLDGAEREPNQDVAHATPLVLSGGTGQLAGFLWPGDADLYRLQGASPNDAVSFEVEGVDKVDLKLERISVDGKPLMRADDAAVGQGEVLPPVRVGDGLVRVSARTRDTAFDAPYRLTATVVPVAPEDEREPNGDAASATPWLPGAAAMHGRLAPRGDEDWYAINGDGTPVSAKVEGPVPGTARVVDETKKPVLPGTPLTAGRRYFLVVKAASEKASNARDPYTVTLSR